MTAFMTSPFFTLEFGLASFTDTTMTSPSEAYLRREPPNTLMHSTRRAPELSATSNIVSVCTIAHRLGRRAAWPSAASARFLQDVAHAPALVLAQRPRLRDQHAVADAAPVLLVVRF